MVIAKDYSTLTVLYPCSRDAMHLRCRADKANELFAQYVATLKPRYGMLRLYKEILKDVQNEGRTITQCNISKVESEIMDYDARLTVLANKFLDN